MLPTSIQGPLDFATLRWRFAHLRGHALRGFQARALRRLVHRAIAGSAFYRELYAGHNTDDFASLPWINKAVMMREFDRLNTAGISLDEAMSFALAAERNKRYLGYFRDRYVVGLSSGTSGARGLYLIDRAISNRLPFAFLARSGMPWRLLPFRIAFLLRVFNQGFADINGPLISLRYLPTMLPVDQAIQRINEMNANILMAPPSMLRLLARHRDRISSPIGIVVSYAEVLEEHEHRKLESAFGTRVVEIYQASEGLIACPCREGRLHINEDLVYVELLDEAGHELTAIDTPCTHMLVTNLYNEVQPLIRYELNDLVCLGRPCSCGSGFRVVAKVIGRDDDVLYFHRSNGSMGHVFPDVLSRWIITASDRIDEYAVEQRDAGHLLVLLEFRDGTVDEASVASVRAAIAHGLLEHGLAMPALEFRVGPVPRSPGKFKRFRRLFAPQEAG